MLKIPYVCLSDRVRSCLNSIDGGFVNNRQMHATNLNNKAWYGLVKTFYFTERSLHIIFKAHVTSTSFNAFKC